MKKDILFTVKLNKDELEEVLKSSYNFNNKPFNKILMIIRITTIILINLWILFGVIVSITESRNVFNTYSYLLIFFYTVLYIFSLPSIRNKAAVKAIREFIHQQGKEYTYEYQIDNDGVTRISTYGQTEETRRILFQEMSYIEVDRNNGLIHISEKKYYTRFQNIKKLFIYTKNLDTETQNELYKLFEKENNDD